MKSSKTQRRKNRLIAATATLLASLTASVVLGLVPSLAGAVGGYAVKWTGGVGVRLRWSAHNMDNKQPVHVAPEGAGIDVLCQTVGEPMGSRANRIWDVISYRGEIAFVPDAYTSTPAPANQFTGGIPRCMPGNAFVQGNQIMGVAVNDVHGWGSCAAQDFSQNIPGFPWGWFMRVGAGQPSHTVRNGMLWGYFDNGGAPGRLGCPTSDEYPYANGARQNFVGGQLEWYPGMNHARLVTGAVVPKPTPTTTPPPKPTTPPPTPPTTAPATAVNLRGTVVCNSGRPVTGVWVAGTSGSGFARWSPEANANVAQYSFSLPRPQTMSLHIGCGGSNGGWASDNPTPSMNVTGSRDVNALCADNASAHSAPCSFPNRLAIPEGTNTYPWGWCTFGAANWFHDAAGVFPNWSDNASGWATKAKAAGWTVVDGIPMARSIFVFQQGHGASTSLGHVGLVTSVSPDGRSFTTMEMNYDWPGHDAPPTGHVKGGIVHTTDPTMRFILMP